MMPDTDSDDTATSSVGCGDDSSYVQPDLACHSIPQEPGPFSIGKFWADRSCVRHTAAEPRFGRDTGMHLTVTLRTDVYRVHGPTANDRLGLLYRIIVNNAVAHCVFQRQPRMPSSTDVIGAFLAV